MPEKPKESVYHKPCPHCGRSIDMYDILDRMFQPIAHTIGHAIKKLLVLGKRSGGKTAHHDAKDAIWSINRWIEMNPEPQEPADKGLGKLPDPESVCANCGEVRAIHSEPWGDCPRTAEKTTFRPS